MYLKVNSSDFCQIKTGIFIKNLDESLKGVKVSKTSLHSPTSTALTSQTHMEPNSYYLGWGGHNAFMLLSLKKCTKNLLSAMQYNLIYRFVNQLSVWCQLFNGNCIVAVSWHSPGRLGVLAYPSWQVQMTRFMCHRLLQTYPLTV